MPRLAPPLRDWAGDRSDRVFLAALGALGLVASWISAAHPSISPFWAPWDFSVPAYAAAGIVCWWYIRGLSRTEMAAWPSRWRRAAFFAGVLVIYAVVQTRFEYMALHMFVLNRVQHVVMHHLGPMLIALSWPGATLKRGAPRFIRRAIENPLLVKTIGLVQQPVPAALLFVGLIFLWLIPTVHFFAMIDRNLYWIMNWSMILDGVLFWFLVLDPRRAPPARVSFATRGALALAVIFPQIAGGAAIAYSSYVLYPYYDLCGRLWPWLGALDDQQMGGLVIWIPASMMSAVALLLVVERYRRSEARSRVARGLEQPVDVMGDPG